MDLEKCCHNGNQCQIKYVSPIKHLTTLYCQKDKSNVALVTQAPSITRCLALRQFYTVDIEYQIVGWDNWITNEKKPFFFNLHPVYGVVITKMWSIKNENKKTFNAIVCGWERWVSHDRWDCRPIENKRRAWIKACT